MIKSILTFLLIALVLFCAHAQTAPVVNADFTKGVLIINNTTFTGNSTVEDYQKVLGKGDRLEKKAGADKVFAYDSMGIALSLKTNTNIVQEVHITYIFDGDKNVAKGAFKGSLSINGTPVTNATTTEQIATQSGLELRTAMKGLYLAKGKLMNLVVYYSESTIAQIGFGFNN
jgi:hypothetical protein